MALTIEEIAALMHKPLEHAITTSDQLIRWYENFGALLSQAVVEGADFEVASIMLQEAGLLVEKATLGLFTSAGEQIQMTADWALNLTPDEIATLI